jgi:hypothetical protein
LGLFIVSPQRQKLLLDKDVERSFVFTGRVGEQEGDRFGAVADPYGHEWLIATHKEDLSPEEIAERGKAAFAAMS